MTDTEKPEAKESRLDWRTIVLTAAVGLVSAAIGGLFTAFVSHKYASSESEQTFLHDQRISVYSAYLIDINNVSLDVLLTLDDMENPSLDKTTVVADVRTFLQDETKMVGEGDVTQVIGDSKIGHYENEYYGKLVQLHYTMLTLQSDVERGLTATQLGPELKTLNTDIVNFNVHGGLVAEAQLELQAKGSK
jgi:hypothetical protein